MPPREPLGHDERDQRDERELRAVRSAGAPGGPELGGPDRLDADEMALRRLGGVARSLTDEDALIDAPPPDVWDAIAARTADIDPAPAPTTLAPELVDPTPLPRRPDDEGRGARWLWLAAAAAVAVVVSAFTVVVASNLGDDHPGNRVLASAQVGPLDGGEPAGSVSAELVESDDRLQLDLSLSDAGLPTTDADFYEVWLIDPDVEGMISLGPARSDGAYAVPADVDYRDFPIVDVSVEPADGNPTHSGVSVLRGTLSS